MLVTEIQCCCGVRVWVDEEDSGKEADDDRTERREREVWKDGRENREEKEESTVKKEHDERTGQKEE